MKKLKLLFGIIALTIASFNLAPYEAEAQSNLNYKTVAVEGTNGYNYIFCSNTAGSDCSTPGSWFRIKKIQE